MYVRVLLAKMMIDKENLQIFSELTQRISKATRKVF